MLYFAAAIRGSRADVGIYVQLIDGLRSAGHVLTEHVIAPDKTESTLSEAEIYARDMAWLEASDAVIAEVSQPSIGVGYELARAQFLAKPILCLYRTSAPTKLSAMVTGNNAFLVRSYTDTTEAVEQALRWLRSIDLA